MPPLAGATPAPRDRFLRFVAAWPTLAGTLSAALGALVLLGWLLDVDGLKQPLPDLPSMKANTALAFLALGLALARTARRGHADAVAQGLALLPLAIGAATLVEYAGPDLGIDELLADDDLAAVATSAPGRMSPLTAASFVLAAAALMAARHGAGRRAALAREALAIVVGLVAVAILSAYAYGATVLSAYSQMAVHTAAAFLIAAPGLLLAVPAGPLARLLRSPGLTGIVARRLLPMSLAIPIFLGAIRIELQQLGYVDTEQGATLFAMSMVLVLAGVSGLILGRLGRLEALRDAAEVRQRAITETAHDAIITAGPDGRIRHANPAALALFGAARDQLEGHELTVLMPERLRAAHRAGFARFLQTRAGRIVGAPPVELVGRRQDGSEFPVELALGMSMLEGQPFFTGVLRDLTERNRGRQALADAVARADRAESATGRGTWEWDVSTDHAVWSKGMYRLFGLDPDTFVNTNENFLALVHPDDRARMGQAIADALAKPGHFHQEYRLTRPDGTVVHIRGEGDVVVGSGGASTVVYGVVEDITQLRAAEQQKALLQQAVATSEARLRAVLDNASDAIITGDGTATIVGWNRAAERIFGWTTAEALGQSMARLMPEAQWKDYQQDIAVHLEGKPPRYLGRAREMVAVRKSGDAIEVELSLAIWPGPAGPMFTGVVRDITERKQAQLEAQRATERFERVFHASPVPISLTKEDGRFLDANEAFCRLVGRHRDELVGTAVRAPDVWEDPQERQRMLSTIRQHGVVRDLELRVKRPDGEVRTTLASIEFVDLGGGTTILALLQDITDRERLQAEREARIANEAELERLRRTDRFRAEFINNIAHELATPLTPLVLKSKALALDKTLSPQQHANAEVIERNVQRLRHFVDDMVGAADLQARSIAIERRRLNLTRELRAAVAANHPAAERGRLDLAEPADAGLTVSADPARLQLVMGHLLGNAIKFTPSGGRITVSSRRVGDDARVEVADTGIGLTRKQMEMLWRPFAQAHDKSQRTDSGSGLGLYVVKGIIDLHGGEVGVSSAGPGQGSTFWFTLPLATGHVDPLSRPHTEEPAPTEPRRNLNPNV